MTHEFLEIFQKLKQYKREGQASVLATVVALDGSSYRRPGVRMLIAENGELTGAVSGGCVEKEVQRRAAQLFETKQPKVITYDGRYRLGCEGILYILLEYCTIQEPQIDEIIKHINARKPLKIDSFYKKEDEATGNLGSVIYNEETTVAISSFRENHEKSRLFSQNLKPLFRLILIGGEHDAVKLCKMAALLGWQVEVYTSAKDPKTLQDFPGAYRVDAIQAENFQLAQGDLQTAVVLMTHNYAQDLQYLLRLQDTDLAYLGILGSAKRRERLDEDLLEYAPELSFSFLENIHSPAGLNLGAETPEEIALSILSEILAICRDKSAVSLKNLSGPIHS